MPHCAPRSAHVFGQHVLEPHTFGAPPPQLVGPPQVSPAVHVPQSRIPQHPSSAMPQVKPCDAHVFGVHGGAPHWFGCGMPHTSHGDVHVPQSSVPPHPSLTIPQSSPSDSHVPGLHPPVPPAPPAPLVLTVPHSQRQPSGEGEQPQPAR